MRILAMSICLWIGVATMAADNREAVLFEGNLGTASGKGALPEGWWAEGCRSVGVVDGRLWQDANPDGSGEDGNNSVVWLDREFSGDLALEFDATVKSAKNKVNDVVVFFLFSDPSGKPLHHTRESRASAKQNLYTDTLNGYVFFTWGKDGVTKPANLRLRACPGGQLLVEKNAYEIETGKTYRFRIEKRGTRLTLAIDGTVYMEYDAASGEKPASVPEKGLIGFKTWNTEMTWGNIRVTRPE